MTSAKADTKRLARALVKVRCPVCGSEREIPNRARRSGRGRFQENDHRECLCGQPLDPAKHEANAIAARERVSLQVLRVRRLREFLTSLANTRKDAPGSPAIADLERLDYFVRSFSEFFPSPFPRTCLAVEAHEASTYRKTYGKEMPAERRKELSLAYLFKLRDDLQLAWCCNDRNSRDWQILGLRRSAWYITAHPTIAPLFAQRRIGTAAPPSDGLQQALLFLQRNPQIARCCSFGGCNQEKFFFAPRGKPNQRYCSDVCYDLSRQQRNKSWWAEHGTAWRKAAKSSRKSGGKSR